MPKSIPTERKLLRCIYDMYASSFPVEGPSVGKVMVTIDIEAVAKKLACDKHILFGYLYYHLDHKCSGQLTPDTGLSFSSATAGARPPLN
jgi:hypothetical protein